MSAPAKKPVLFFGKKPVKACGIILVHHSEEPYFLLQKRGKYYEDFGGRIEPTDRTVFDTMIREAQEESNYRFDPVSLYQRLCATPFFYYHKKANYLYAVLHATDEEVCLSDGDFGQKETYQNIERQVTWVPTSQLVIGNVHPRLLTSALIRV